MPSNRPLVIVPTYNEIESLPRQIELINSAGTDVDILVVDDSSPDGTADWVRERQLDNPRLHLLDRPEKQGLGPAYIAGFRWASEHGYNTVLEMDADGSHPADRIPDLLNALDGGAELSIGSRWVHGGRVIGWPVHRYLLSRLGNFYIRAMLRLPVKDATAGFRAYRTALLERIDLSKVQSAGYSFQTEMTLRAIRADAQIAEVPITFRERDRGQSKMSLSIMAESLAKVTRWGVSRKSLT